MQESEYVKHLVEEAEKAVRTECEKKATRRTSQTQRYLRLNSFIPELLDLVDRQEIPLMVGVDSISSALKELENAGYVVRKRVRNEQGRLCGTEYIIYQIPQKALRTKTDLNGKILCWLKQTKRNLNRKHQNQYNKKSYRKKKVKSNLHGKKLYR